MTHKTMMAKIACAADDCDLRRRAAYLLVRMERHWPSGDDVSLGTWNAWREAVYLLSDIAGDIANNLTDEEVEAILNRRL